MADVPHSIQCAGQDGLWSRAAPRGSARKSPPCLPTPAPMSRIVGRDAEGLDATWQAVVEKGRRCIAIQADLRTVEGPRIAGARPSSFSEPSTSS